MRLCHGPDEANRSLDILEISLQKRYLAKVAYDGSRSTVFGNDTVMLGMNRYRSRDSLVGAMSSLV